MAVSGVVTSSGRIISLVLFMVSMGILCVCLSRRVQNIRDWGRLPIVCWLIIVIYVDSLIFIIGASILSHGYDMESGRDLCSNAVLLCLACYMTTKVFIYYFLVERAYIIRGTTKPRMKDKVYLFNSFGMLVPYCVVIVLNFYYRFAIYNEADHSCRIGMKYEGMIPLIVFDILVNVYLTFLFLIPLRALYSYKTNRNSQPRVLALRTFIGSCATLVSSVVNLTTVMLLQGEPGWICLMCCNIDILFSVLVLHWITSKDNASTQTHASNATPSIVVPSNNILPVSTPTYESSPENLMTGPRPSDLEACENTTQEHESKCPGVVTRVTACSNEVDNDPILQRLRSTSMSPLPGTVMVEINHVQTVESIGLFGINIDEDSMEEDADQGMHREGNKRESVAGSVKEARMRAERSRNKDGKLKERGREGKESGDKGEEEEGEWSASLVAGGAPIERLDSDSSQTS